MKNILTFSCNNAKALVPLLLAMNVQAGVITTGNINPATDPTTWTSTTNVRVGDTADGSITINAETDINSATSDIGYNSGVPGAVTVTDSGSTWSNSSELRIGRSGNGSLSILNGGAVSNQQGGTIGSLSESTGAVTVDGGCDSN